MIEKNNKQSRALTTSGVHHVRSAMVQKVSEIMEIKPHVAQSLLNKSKWDQEKLLCEYFNDPEAFLAKSNLNVSNISTSTDSKKEDEKSEEEEEITCSICFDDLPKEETTKLEGCGHVFCNGCWSENLSIQINQGQTIEIKCMQQGCEELVPSHVVQKLVPPDISSKYNTFLGKNFVENSNNIIWCPSPGCELALSEPVSEGKIRLLTCACGYRICFKCRKEAHPPVLCELITKFEKEAEDDENLKYMVENKLDAETLNWMHENTKQCPFCNVAVQKNDGCYCMTCSNCHKQWCWLCRDPWETHSDHFRCSKYNADRDQLKDKPAHQDEDAFKKRLALEKLAKFFRFFHEQSNNIALEDKKENKQKDQEKMEELQKEISSLDVSFIPEGRLMVKKCRETLKYSYVHTYFAREEELTDIVNYLQGNLEMCTEKLAQALQKPANEISAPEVRKSTKIAAAALENLLSHITDENIEVKQKKTWKTIAKRPKKI